MVVKRSGVTVRLFALPRKHCSSYIIACYLAGKRHREMFRGILDQAKACAEEIAEQISAQEAGHGVLPPKDLRAYQSAVEKLEPLGVALSDAVDEYGDVPKLDAEALQTAAKRLESHGIVCVDCRESRPTRDLKWLRFFPQVKEITFYDVEVEDYSPLAALAGLKCVFIYDARVTDLRPFGECRPLQDALGADEAAATQRGGLGVAPESHLADMDGGRSGI